MSENHEAKMMRFLMAYVFIFGIEHAFWLCALIFLEDYQVHLRNRDWNIFENEQMGQFIVIPNFVYFY